MRFSTILFLLALVLGVGGYLGYRYGLADITQTQAQLSAISDDAWSRGTRLQALETVPPAAMMLLARLGNTRAQAIAGGYLMDGAYNYPLDVEKAQAFLESAAADGDVRGMLALAALLTRRTPERVPDIPRARQLIDRAMEQEAPLALHYRAIMLMGLDPDNADGEEALRLLTLAYDARVAGAGATIARIRWNTGRWNTPASRLALMQEAAADGSSTAQAILGNTYYTGTADTEKDIPRALQLLEEADRRGSSIARLSLGLGYVDGGEGFTQDRETGVALIRRAAEQGHFGAQTWIAKDLRESEPSEGLRWFQSAADGGHAEAIYQLARCHSLGECSLERNDAEGIRLFVRAADLGHNYAGTIVGLIYEADSSLGPRDDERALHYHLIGAQDNPNGKFRLGRFLMYDGPHQNAHEGARLIREAADEGHEEAASWAGAQYHHGTFGVQPNEALALRYYRASPNWPMSQVGMALFYYYGEGGLPQDRARAIELAQTAARSGEALARRQLERWGESW